MYPPGLPHHPSSPLAIHSLLSYVINCGPWAILSRSILGKYHSSIVRLNREPYCSFPYCSLFLALTSLLRNYRSPIILLFSRLGVGTSHLYIRATISLELGLKPNLVFNPRLVASPVSLLRVPLYHLKVTSKLPLKLSPFHCITVHLAVAILHFKLL